MKIIAVILFLLTATFASAAPRDFIVLMDTSQYMFDEYDTVIQNYFPDVVKEHLQLNDVFHLISFSDHPELELTQKISTRQDMEAILRRLLLLQPLGKYDDPLLALRFVYQYASGLPSYQEKTIVVFTPGLYEAPNQDHASPEAAKKEIGNVISEIRNRGWNLRFVLISTPTSSTLVKDKHSVQANESSPMSLDLAKMAQHENVPAYVFQPQPGFSNETLGIPRINLPKDLGKIHKDFNLNFKVSNPADSAVILHLKEVTCNGISLLAQDYSINLAPHENKDVSVPLSFSKLPSSGSQTGQFHLIFQDDLQAYPNEATIHFDYVPGLEIWLLPFGIGIGILLLLGLLVLLFKLLRKGYEHGKILANRHVEEKVKNSILQESQPDENAVQRPNVSLSSDQQNDLVRKEDKFQKPLSKQSKNLVQAETKSSEILEKPISNDEIMPQQKQDQSSQIHRAEFTPTQLIPTEPVSKKKQNLKPEWNEVFTKKQVQSSLALDSATSHSSKVAPEILSPEPDKTLDEFRTAAEAREQARREEQNHLLSTLSKSSQKSDSSFSAFLKQNNAKSSEEVKTISKVLKKDSSVGKVPAVLASPSRLIEVKEGPSKEFTMLVWTSDFLFQNTRQPANWFRFRPGERKTIGNSKANFKIVLVPVSEVVAEVSYDGHELFFHPIAQEYFPELADPTACLNMDIPVHIQGEKVLYLRFMSKTSKTEEVNKFLRGDPPALEDTLS